MSVRSRNIIGPQLRKIRYKLALSQPELAAECQRRGWDISRDIVARIECQTRWVADFELVLLAQVLKIDVQALLPDAKKLNEKLRGQLEQ